MSTVGVRVQNDLLGLECVIEKALHSTLLRLDVSASVIGSCDVASTLFFNGTA